MSTSSISTKLESSSVETARDEIQTELARGHEASVIRVIDTLLVHAHSVSASDIHIDPGLATLIVRFRCDGVLETAHVFPLSIHHELISRLKVLSGLRTDEHQTAQDGRFRFMRSDEDWIDVRISIAPTYHGENAVLRLLSATTGSSSLEELGFTSSHKKILQRLLRKTNGMILVTGPTGSGKTTTLYALIAELVKESVSVVTIEDPIEYSMEGVNQIQANQRSGLSFAQGLRSILRQDPDIIMVGEIRDQETAGLAVNAALTGHLVLSTLHTNDAPTTLPRLLDMKVEPYLIAGTVTLVIGQRLVRRICRGCKTARVITSAESSELRQLFTEEIILPTTLYTGAGCSACNDTGYRGRLGVYELLPINESIQDAIIRRVSAREIRNLAQKNGMLSMNMDGLEKADLGLTTLDEILRIRHE